MKQAGGICILFLALMLTSCKKEPLVIHMIGDSTMSEKRQDARPETGWGEMFSRNFSHEVKVHNHALNGRSSRSFMEEGHWSKVLNVLDRGDYLLIQFGHNDQKVDSERYASPESYGENLKRYVRECREKGAIPLILTPIVRRRFNEDGIFYDVHGDYPDVARRVAKENEVALVDMHAETERLLKEHGDEGSKKFFQLLEAGQWENYPDGRDDNTHLSPEGATAVAGIAAKALALEIPEIGKYLNSP